MPRLFLIADRSRLPDPLAAAARLPRGAGVILRDYGLVDRERMARAMVMLGRRRGLRILIAGDARLARRVGADGVHLPEGMARALRERRPRAACRNGWLVTAAAHGPAALWRARRAGAQAALLSPVFATASHPGARPIGPLRFARWCRESPLPVIALGGIDGRTARRLRGVRLAGFAAIGAFCQQRR